MKIFVSKLLKISRNRSKDKFIQQIFQKFEETKSSDEDKLFFKTLMPYMAQVKGSETLQLKISSTELIQCHAYDEMKKELMVNIPFYI